MTVLYEYKSISTEYTIKFSEGHIAYVDTYSMFLTNDSLKDIQELLKNPYKFLKHAQLKELANLTIKDSIKGIFLRTNYGIDTFQPTMLDHLGNPKEICYETMHYKLLQQL